MVRYLEKWKKQIFDLIFYERFAFDWGVDSSFEFCVDETFLFKKRIP